MIIFGWTAVMGGIRSSPSKSSQLWNNSVRSSSSEHKVRGSNCHTQIHFPFSSSASSSTWLGQWHLMSSTNVLVTLVTFFLISCLHDNSFSRYYCDPASRLHRSGIWAGIKWKFCKKKNPARIFFKCCTHSCCLNHKSEISEKKFLFAHVHDTFIVAWPRVNGTTPVTITDDLVELVLMNLLTVFQLNVHLWHYFCNQQRSSHYLH